MHSSKANCKKYLSLLALVMFLWGMCAKAANADVTVEQAQAIAALVVGNNSIPLKLSGPPFPRTDIPGMNGKIFRFAGPETEGIEIDIDCTTGALCRFSYRRLAYAGQTTKIPMSEAVRTGKVFLRRYLSTALHSQFKMQPSQSLDQGAGGKLYLMRWFRYVDGVKYPAGVNIKGSLEKL